MSCPRDPDAILAELGADLRTAWDREPTRRRSRPRTPRPRWAVLLAGLVLLGGPTALAGRDALRSEPLPALPDSVRPSGAAAPDAASGPVLVAQGTDRGVAWRLSASACRYGASTTVGVFLSVPGGGAGTNCATGGAGPATGRRVQTYYDAAEGRTWVFAALPSAARSVVTTVPAARASALAADPATSDRGIPAGVRVVVLSLDGLVQMPSLTVLDAAGSPLSTCSVTSCTTPIKPQEAPPR